MAAAVRRGACLVNIGPLRSDLPAGSRWLPVPPGSDTALMLALLHTLVVEDRHDAAFLDRYCVGWDKLADYVLGAGGAAKDADWAAPITGVAAEDIRECHRVSAIDHVLDVGLAQKLEQFPRQMPTRPHSSRGKQEFAWMCFR